MRIGLVPKKFIPHYFRDIILSEIETMNKKEGFLYNVENDPCSKIGEKIITITMCERFFYSSVLLTLLNYQDKNKYEFVRPDCNNLGLRFEGDV